MSSESQLVTDLGFDLTRSSASPLCSRLLSLSLLLVNLFLLLFATNLIPRRIIRRSAKARRRRRTYLHPHHRKSLRNFPFFNGRSTEERTKTPIIPIHPKERILSTSPTITSPEFVALNQLKTNLTPSPLRIHSSKDNDQLEELDNDNPTETTNEPIELDEDEKNNEERERPRQTTLSSVSVKRMNRSQARSTTLNPTLSAPIKNLSSRFNDVTVRKIPRPFSSDHH